jgi:hypothetical protein
MLTGHYGQPQGNLRATMGRNLPGRLISLTTSTLNLNLADPTPGGTPLFTVGTPMILCITKTDERFWFF